MKKTTVTTATTTTQALPNKLEKLEDACKIKSISMAFSSLGLHSDDFINQSWFAWNEYFCRS